MTDKYLHGIPADSRIAQGRYLKKDDIGEDVLRKVAALNDLALRRGQTLAQMAIAWLLANRSVTSVIIGTRTTEQLKDNLGALEVCRFADDELALIDTILKG